MLVGAAGGVAVADIMLRQVVPMPLSLLLPVLGFGAGLILARRPPPKVEALSRIDRAAIELDYVSVGPPAFVPPLPATNLGQDSTVVAFPVATPKDENVERAVTELDQYYAFTDILNSQMNSVAELSEEAAGSILSNLVGVDTKISALLAFIQQSGSNDRAAAVVTQIESQMQGCAQLLDRFAASQLADAQQGHQQRSKIAAETKSVLDVLEGVSGIARQTTMLSLNVSIEAARAGEAGRGFSVIANEIRKLASEVQELSNEVHQRVETLMRTVTVDLHEQAKHREEVERDAIANISETLSGLTDNLMTLITHQRDIMSKVESENEAIAGPLMDIMGSIQFQDIIRQQLEQLNRMAEMVGEHIKAVGGMLGEAKDDMGEETLSQKLDDMFSTYVMARQRETHLAARGQAVAQDAGPRIELF